MDAGTLHVSTSNCLEWLGRWGSPAMRMPTTDSPLDDSIPSPFDVRRLVKQTGTPMLPSRRQ